MIPTREHHPWPGDTALQDPQAGGLPASCLVRLKLVTLDNRQIRRRARRLANKDAEAVELHLRRYLPCPLETRPLAPVCKELKYDINEFKRLRPIWYQVPGIASRFRKFKRTTRDSSR
jgi:hypothetical protein